MKTLTENQMTLRAVMPEDRNLFEAWDNERDVLTFTDWAPWPLSEDWSLGWEVSDKHGRLFTIAVRAADCGLGCRCAGEYMVTRRVLDQED